MPAASVGKAGSDGRLLARLAGEQRPGRQQPRMARRLLHDAFVAHRRMVEPHRRVIDQGLLDIGEIHLLDQFVGGPREAKHARAVGAERAIDNRRTSSGRLVKWEIRCPGASGRSLPQLIVHVCRRM